MKKLINDLLKSPSSGKYSRKSIIIMLTFLTVLSIAVFIVVDNSPNNEAKSVLDTLLMFLTAMLSLATVDKKIENKDNKPTEE